MARKKKQSKKTRSRASVVRQDYRKGGRVKAFVGLSKLKKAAKPPRPKRSDYGSSDEGGHLEYRQALREWEATQNQPAPSTEVPIPVPEMEKKPTSNLPTTTTPGESTDPVPTIPTTTPTIPTTTPTTTTPTTTPTTTTPTGDGWTVPGKDDIVTQAVTHWYNPDTGERRSYPTGGYSPPPGSAWIQVDEGTIDPTPTKAASRYPRPNRRDFGDEGGLEYKQELKEWQENENQYFEENPNDPDAPPNWNNPSPDDPPTDPPTDPTPVVVDDAVRNRVSEGLEGIVPDAAKIADPIEVDDTIKQDVTTMEEPTQAQTFQADDQAPEAVKTEQAQAADETIGQDLETSKIEDVATVGDKDVAVDAAEGEVTRGPIGPITGEITAGVEFATVDELKIEAGKAERIEDVLGPDNDYLVKEVKGNDTTVSPTPDAEKQTRKEILGEPAPDGVEAFIEDIVGYTAAKQRIVKGKAAQGDAASMIAAEDIIPPEIAEAIVQNPETVEAQLDEEPVEVQAAIAALPTEALVSSQMQTLLGGMEDGEIPLWAKPAVAAVNQGMAARGLSVSTVGRDSLFNAIIQSALPMAQSNAQALQQRAAQNLSNEQQANLAQSTQDMQRRMANLANRQTAGSQTAQMSQQMRVLQSQFEQQAIMTTAEQRQQTRTQDLQNRQQEAVVNVQNAQQMAVQNLGNEQQLNMAELQVEANAVGANQAAENQELMIEFQVAADFMAKNEGFKQQMELANLSNDQQMRLANLSSKNLHQSELLSNAEKTELANLNKAMQTNQLQAQIASQMNLAQLNVDQQSAIQNATTKANLDLTKFNDAQQVELANSKFMQTVALTDMNAEQQAIMQNATAVASMDIANLGTRERLAVTNAQNFLAMDMANLNNEQQANMLKSQQLQQRLLSDQAATNAAKQFNSASENQTNQFMASMAAQMNQYNTAQINSMKQFNATQTNAAAARDANRAADVEKFNTQLETQVDQFNSNQDFARNQWNAQNRAVVEQSNTQWRRQANTANTAAQNAVNMQNAQNAFALSQTAMSFLWQEMRDNADYDFREGENEKNRISQIVNTALASDPSKYGGSLSNIKDLIGAITGDIF